jgi:hypothetical protein
MPRVPSALSALVLATLTLAARAAGAQPDTGEKLACAFDPGKASSCAPFACVPDVPAGTDPNMILAGTAGFCGKCTDDRQCGGARCNTRDGLCAMFDPSPRPEPVWPHFHLLVTDAAVNLADATDARPIVSAGYLFQGAFRKTRPQPFGEHGFLSADLPRFYWQVAGTLALAGPAQNAFAEAGLTYYWPAGPWSISTLSLLAEYQRQGASIWDLGDASENGDRVGPGVSVGIMQNIFLRLAYVFPLRGPTSHGALIVGVSYMKNLLSDLVPDRFLRFLPAKLN